MTLAMFPHARFFLRNSQQCAALVCALVLMVLAACSSNEVDPDDLPAELVSFDSTLKVRKVWSKSVGSGTENLRLPLRPVEHGSTIFAAAHDGTVLALDAANGSKRWEASTDLPLSSGPATDGELVVAGSSNGDVIALDASTGAYRWSVTVTSEVLAAAAL